MGVEKWKQLARLRIKKFEGWGRTDKLIRNGRMKRMRRMGLDKKKEDIITRFDAVGHQNLIRIYTSFNKGIKRFPLGGIRSIISKEKKPPKTKE